MAKPAIVVVDASREARATTEQHLARRYADAHDIIAVAGADAGVQLCRDLRRDGRPVALAIVAADIGGVPGATVLAAVRAAHPDAGRVLLAEAGTVEDAMLAAPATGVHRYLVPPLEPPQERLYPVLDEVLEDWGERAATPYVTVGSIMDTSADVGRIGPDASLLQAAELVAATRVSDLMVVRDGDAFLGVLSEGDILRNALPDFDAIVEAGGALHDAYQLFVRTSSALARAPIAPLVIRDPIVLRPDDHVAAAATILVERQIRRLPVVDDGRLLGTVSRANICQAVVGAA